MNFLQVETTKKELILVNMDNIEVVRYKDENFRFEFVDGGMEDVHAVSVPAVADGALFSACQKLDHLINSVKKQSKGDEK